MASKKIAKAPQLLKGWAAIAKFLSQPTSTVQRWASEGMPVKKLDVTWRHRRRNWSDGWGERRARKRRCTFLRRTPISSQILSVA
jgi:hypothetical protein